MFSGKTQRLLARIQQARSAGRTVAVFKHASDVRYAAHQLVTHNGLRIEATPADRVETIAEAGDRADAIVIDEAQFFGSALVGLCERLRARGVDLVIAGLDRDSWGLPFEPMPAVEAMADDVVRTYAVCSKCQRPAAYTQRLTPVGDQTMIGGAESYEPRCEACFSAPPMELRR